MPLPPSPINAASHGERSEPGRPGPGALPPPFSRCPHAAARLTAWVVVATSFWLVALPRIGELPAVRTTIRRNESLGIDPSAKFYSELPAMPRFLSSSLRHLEQVLDTLRIGAERRLDELARSLAPMRAGCAVVTGRAYLRIAEMAIDVDADLVVIGDHKPQHGLARFEASVPDALMRGMP